MKRQNIIKMVAEWFDIEPDEDGRFDLSDYDWQSGCSMLGKDKWLTLAEVVDMIDTIGDYYLSFDEDD